MFVKLHKLHYCYIVHTTYKSLALLSLLNDSNTSVDYLKKECHSQCSLLGLSVVSPARSPRAKARPVQGTTGEYRPHETLGVRVADVGDRLPSGEVLRGGDVGGPV